ncbi:FKBP-type peptidyl-prolyl cis-trans isomerase N-terminal domain-containing protein [Escherichia coli]|uniref:FKBP-type peptidyl-prolyl cis-trans isomerase N-terminal domain-containing protein n=1 Tax=Escherichia coli TaxID=562 RepID=UPI00203649B6|nr:FKBP-type peptidyl-prolyl cis-trans isomerase N-terminal domain-containing protein [Escherichia coli]
MNAAIGDNQPSTTDEGIPGVPKYAQQYQREKAADTGEQQKQISSGAEEKKIKESPLSVKNTGNTELRRRLTLREQELRQLKKENHSLRDRLQKMPAQKPETEKNRDKDRQIIELKQQIAHADINKKTAAEFAREKTELMSSLNALKKELAEMPVVTPEILKTESVQLTYAAGVMMGRDMLNLQSAQQKLGLKTDNRILLAGIRDALNQKVLLNENALDSALHKAEEVAQKARLEVIREQKKAGAAYLDKFRKQNDVKQADSGFWYRTEYAGDGDFIHGDSTQVDVVVTEKLTDGTIVEDMDARGRVISQALSDYPPLFREALMLMKNHGTVELVVPPELAYGDNGYPPKVPPGATMLYTIRVDDVKRATVSKTAEVRAEGEKK